MPLIETKGAASAQGFGGAGAGASGPVTYIEDVFSTWLYTGNGTTQTITNGIDLSGKGGLVWIKGRSGATDHALYDTTRGATKDLVSNSTAAETTQSTGLTAFNGTGFSIGALAKLNTNAATYVSWTFRKQPKFFDVVTFTSTASTNQRISHSLGSVPGCIIVKAISSGSSFYTYHSSLGRNKFLQLNDTAGELTITNIWGTSNPTSTDFGIDGSSMFLLGTSCVAYLFAHDAGGFGLSGTDNVISCGSFTGNTTVNLGYEPQWLLIKNYAGIDSWTIMDNMRGMPNPGNSVALLRPNTSGAEGVGQGAFPTATGFTTTGYSGLACIYIAIRRGPMKTPTSGTSVFSPIAVTPSSGTVSTTNFAQDALLLTYRPGGDPRRMYDKLRGVGSNPAPPYEKLLRTNTTDAEVDSTPVTYDWWNTGFTWSGSYAGLSMVSYSFRRAPGFFDVVCYNGSGSTSAVNHNLGVQPELIIYKSRSNDNYWIVHTPSLISQVKFLRLDSTDASANNSTQGYTNSGTPTATTITPGTIQLNQSGWTYVAYLFATVAGVSKVGNYTGTGALQTVNCGFTGGARFVLIKRTDSTGDWYVYDSARGISSGNDPYLFLNSTAAEVTGTNYVDTTSVGFQVTAAAPAGLNANGGTYIFLAIA